MADVPQQSLVRRYLPFPMPTAKLPFRSSGGTKMLVKFLFIRLFFPMLPLRAVECVYLALSKN